MSKLYFYIYINYEIKMGFEDELEDEETMPQCCPNCGREYDDIDYEFQICHICGFDNSQSPYDEDDNDPNDSRNL